MDAKTRLNEWSHGRGRPTSRRPTPPSVSRSGSGARADLHRGGASGRRGDLRRATAPHARRSEKSAAAALQAAAENAGLNMTEARPPQSATPTRAGFVAVIWARPTRASRRLVNRLVGTKVSIVTQKVQTTRFPVRGRGDAGRREPDRPGRYPGHLHARAGGSTAPWCVRHGMGREDADAVVHLVDVERELGDPGRPMAAARAPASARQCRTSPPSLQGLKSSEPSRPCWR